MVVLASVIVPMLLYPEQLTTAEPSIPATAYTFLNSLSAVTVAITDILAVANIHTLLYAVTVEPDCTEAEANICFFSSRRRHTRCSGVSWARIWESRHSMN